MQKLPKLVKAPRWYLDKLQELDYSDRSKKVRKILRTGKLPR